jgi:hypothetical protein
LWRLRHNTARPDILGAYEPQPIEPLRIGQPDAASRPITVIATLCTHIALRPFWLYRTMIPIEAAEMRKLSSQELTKQNKPKTR